jgi:hypothetical protein
MEILTNPDPRRSGAIYTILATLALATMLSGAGAAIARADDGHNRGHENRGHQDHRGDRQRHDDWGPRGYIYARPGAYYGPPPVDYYQPPPPPPAIDFVFPLHLR